ncbi:MAG: class I SAM-dependent methyltransferase [Myxococcota bacterium]|nr:class I SAM-dependent methyltransferase [Myxococcota bacterium]
MRYAVRSLTLTPRRYRRLLEAVYDRRPRTIVEVGTYDGRHACQMIETAAVFAEPGEIDYHGFDLFDRLTEDELRKEFSKRPPSRAEVQERLERTGARIHLYEGYSRDTMPALQRNERTGDGIDFAFIDGGHSLETVACDWENVRRVMDVSSVVILDDYYPGDEPQVRDVGCRTLIEGLDRGVYDVEVLDPEDRFVKDWGVLRVRMVRARLRRPAAG